MEKLYAYFLEMQASLPANGPGFSSIVIQDGHVAFELHHGLGSLELGVPLSGDSAYYLASESKQFTAACIFSLIKAGMIRLDDDVVPYLPELSEFKQAFSLRTLLNHSSGIPDYFQFLHCQPGRHDSDYFNNEIILKIIERMDTVLISSGAEHRYSNSNYILLATLVERLSGKSCAEYAREIFFAPLGIEQMRFDADRFDLIPHRILSYEKDDMRPSGFEQNLGNANTVGDGGIYASTNALLLWERHWHSQWSDPASIVQAMLAPSPLLDGTIPSYRFGLEVCLRHGMEVVFHGGSLWGFGTIIIRIPAIKVSIIQLANCDLASPDFNQLIDRALS